MKKIWTLILFIGLVMTACTHLNVNGSNNGFLGSTLNLNEALYIVDLDDSNNILIFEQIKDDFTFTTDVGGEGTYFNGQMDFFIDKPALSLFKPISDIFDVFVFNEEENYYTFLENELALAFYKSLSYSDPLARFAMLRTLETPKGMFGREYASETQWDFVIYVYVDRDVTITAKGATLQKWATLITDDLNIDLKTGWNAIHYHVKLSSTDHFTTINSGNPSYLRWSRPSDRYTAH